MRLVYHIDEGPQTRVRRILVTGYEHTRPGVIRREIRVKPRRAAARRRRGGIAAPSLQPRHFQSRDDRAAKSQRDRHEQGRRRARRRSEALYHRVRRRLRSSAAGQHHQSRRQRSAGGSARNSGDQQAQSYAAAAIRSRSSCAAARSKTARCSPIPIRTPSPIRTSRFRQRRTPRKRRTSTRLRKTRYEGSVQLTDQSDAATTLQYRYTFRKVAVSNLNNTVSPEEIPLFEQPTLVSQFGVTWARDARDNPADATKGSFNSADFGIADTGIGSSAQLSALFLSELDVSPDRAAIQLCAVLAYWDSGAVPRHRLAELSPRRPRR